MYYIKMNRLDTTIPPREIQRVPGGGGVGDVTGYRTTAGFAVATFVLVAGVVRDWKICDRDGQTSP